MTGSRGDVDPDLLGALRSVCVGLPRTYEEPAWAGTRWRIGGKTFAHVLHIGGGWPPAYVKAARTSGPATVLTFRSSEPERYAHGRARHPFFSPGWFPDLVGLVIEPNVDWHEVARLLLESYCVLAPKRLVQLLIAPEETTTGRRPVTSGRSRPAGGCVLPRLPGP